MLNQNLKYLITEDNNQVEPLIQQNLFETSLDYLGVISTLIIILINLYKRLWLLTGILTPGNELVEIGLILLSIGLFVICKLIANYILNDLSVSFNKLKDKNDSNDKIISCLHKKISKLKSTINELKIINDELKMDNNILINKNIYRV
jgi:hypothetical protein